MTRFETCSRCHEPLEEGVRRGIIIEYYPGDPTIPEILCKECMKSFLNWKEIMRSKEAKE